jgi:hypothetical protein
MLEDGLSYPLRGDWIGRVIIGGVLGFLSVLVLPAFVLLGYLVRVLETTVDGSEDPPEFVDWGDLLVTGVVGTVITLAYTVVPIVGYVLLVVVLVGTGGAVGGDLGALAGVAGLLATLAFIPVVLVVYYAVPAALTAYAAHGEIGAAFDLAALKPTLFSPEYLVAVLMPLVVAVVLWIATGLLAITILGLLLVPFLQFYGQMAVFRMFGSAFASETDRIDTDRAESPDLAGR